MSIAATCPHCGKKYTLDDSLGGKKARCKVCKEIFEIPQPHVRPKEVTAGGIPVYRHPGKSKRSPDVPAVTPYMKQIEAHIERTIGPIGQVFHEIISDDIHLDLYIVPPTGKEPSEEFPLGTNHYTIITGGLSARAQNVPPDAREDISPFQELMIALPADWPGMNPDGTWDSEVTGRDENWWPIAFMKLVARMPHEYDTFLAPGVTIPNGEDAVPFADNTQLGCMMVFQPILCPAAHKLQVTDDLEIQFYALWPIYKEEMNLKLSKGLQPLLEKLVEAELTELFQPGRPNLCKKKGWFGR
jgi:hypothetical protein